MSAKVKTSDDFRFNPIEISIPMDFARDKIMKQEIRS